MNENNTQGVEFTEEKDAIQDRMDASDGAEYTGLLGWVMRKTGYSRQKASMILLLVAIVFFTLSFAVFSVGSFERSIERSDPGIDEAEVYRLHQEAINSENI